MSLVGIVQGIMRKVVDLWKGQLAPLSKVELAAQSAPASVEADLKSD
jgi:hypothetical protein